MVTPLLFWGAFALFLFGYSLVLVNKERAYKTLAVIAVLMCLLPIAWVTVDCSKNNSSEACVWGQAYMPLSLGIALLIGTPLGFLVYYYSKKLWRLVFVGR